MCDNRQEQLLLNMHMGLREINCIIFDCDGALVDSEKLGNQVMIDLFAEYGVVVEPDNYRRLYRGVQLREIIARLEAAHNVKTADDFIDRYRHRLDAMLAERLQPIPGIHNVLRQLALPKCVATSAPQEKLRLCLGVTGLRSFFGDNLFSSYDINSWKPKPDIFLHAAKTMGFAPAECAVVEDSPVGVAAGLAAGMTTIHFNHNGEHEVIEGVIAIQQMEQLPALLFDRIL